jgi:hypothetical protein
VLLIDSDSEEESGKAPKEVSDLMQELTKKDATIVDLEEQLRKVYEVRRRHQLPANPTTTNARGQGSAVAEWVVNLTFTFTLRRRPSGTAPTRPPAGSPRWRGRWWRRSP